MQVSWPVTIKFHMQNNVLGERYKKLLRDIRVQLWLPYSLFMCFFCPFSILINLLGVEGAGLCVYRAFVC